MEKIEDSAGISKLHEELFIRPRYPVSFHGTNAKEEEGDDDDDEGGGDQPRRTYESDANQTAVATVTPRRLEMFPRTDRLQHFMSSLIEFVSKKHAAFLKSLPEHERGTRMASTWWHPQFPLKSVPDIPCGELPHAERHAAYTFKTLSRDVAESDARMREQIVSHA
jgi:hypothetical protein